MLRFICLTALLCATTARAESPTTPMCACTAEQTCWESARFCVETDEICETSESCAPGLICDRRDGDAAVPGRCVEATPACDADTDCGADELCSGAGIMLPTCAEDDAACAAARTPICGWPALCDEADPAACVGDMVCVQERCTTPELVDAISAIDTDEAHIARYRDYRNAGNDDESCAAAPGRPGLPGIALLGFALALRLRRRR